MKVPMKWLGEYVDIGLSPKELANRMTMAGLEAEKIEEIGELWDKVFVGYVHRVERHPNADRLVLADIEAGEHRLTVVTGAPNIAAGQNVALALAGARLYDGHSDSSTPELKMLKPGVIRGVTSEGMACSEKELGISAEHEGILILPEDAPVGAPLRDYLGDTVIEFEITPNLTHAFSILGIAREASALTASPLHRPAITPLGTFPVADDSLVTVEANDLCSRYVAVVIENLTVRPSPDWLVRRLTSAGLRSINNIVDVTNYVMHELGQPLHAFDRDHLDGRRIVVRRAKPGEQLESLDHVQRTLSDDMLVIADASRAVGLAGVIGGFTSEVSETTTTIVLESANFEMRSVRQTARALKLRTDASARFERGLDPNLASEGAARAVDLFLQLCPEAKVAAVADVYPEVVKPRSLTFPVSRIGRLLGVDYEQHEILEALARLEFDPAIDEVAGERQLTVQIPTYRRDVSIPVDIIEEVARVIGYERLPDTLPLGRSIPVQRDDMYRLRKSVRDFLVGCGGIEAVTYVTVSSGELQPFLTSDGNQAGFLRSVPVADLLAIKNPLQSGRNILRPTVVSSLLESVAANLRHAAVVRLFEMARVYLRTSRDELPNEIEVAAIAMAGRRTPLEVGASDEQVDFFDLKGILDELWARLAINPEIGTEPYPGLHPGRSAVYYLGQELIGRIGELHPDTAKRFGIEDIRVVVAEIDLSTLLASHAGQQWEITVPRYLPVEQDFAVIVDESMPAGNVRAALEIAGKPLASAITLFDVYRGDQIGEGKKSLAFRVTFTAPDRTLTDAELVKVRTRIEKTLSQRVSGVLRT